MALIKRAHNEQILAVERMATGILLVVDIGLRMALRRC
jgi:hypothetical protein